jgi:hypothetical protein
MTTQSLLIFTIAVFVMIALTSACKCVDDDTNAVDNHLTRFCCHFASREGLVDRDAEVSCDVSPAGEVGKMFDECCRWDPKAGVVERMRSDCWETGS